MALALVVAMTLAAAPPPVASEEASVLIAEAVALDATKIAKAWREVAADAAPLAIEARDGRLVVTVAGVGEAVVRVEAGRLEGAAAAFSRGLSALISDEAAPAHGARVVIALTKGPKVARSAAMEALARLGLGVMRAVDGVGVHFAAGQVLHPKGFAAGVLRDRLPLSWLWVGIELGGTKDALRLMSRGLGESGLRELVLEVKRQDIGFAIQSFYELVALVLARGSDYPDGHELAREDAPAFVVRHGDEGGVGVWRIAFSAPPPK